MKDPESKGILLEVGTNEVEFLLFRLGHQAYGINVAKVFQILLFEAAKVAALPHQTSGMLGVMDLRGETISVVDLKEHLGSKLGSKEETRKLLLIAEFNKHRTAFVVDGVDRIERCSWKQFEPMRTKAGGEAQSSVVGTVTLRDEIVILLDVETIMGTLNPSMSVEYYEKDISPEGVLDRSAVSIVSCEDSAVVQRVLLRTLETAGFKKIRAFSTGAEGFEYLSASKEPVDIILSDIEMPQMDGLTLCKNVRNLGHHQVTPFIFFSSMINEQMARKCKAVGGDAWFSKPEIHTLVDAIDSLVQKSRAAPRQTVAK